MPEQMIIWPDDEFDGLKGDKRLELLRKIDISQFIPLDVYNYYYQDTGRPPFMLKSMLLALLAQKIFKIPTIELLILPFWTSHRYLSASVASPRDCLMNQPSAALSSASGLRTSRKS